MENCMIEEPDYDRFTPRPADDEPVDLCDLCDNVAEHRLERFGIVCDCCLWRVSGVQ
jgi:hypothetical protein